MVKLFSNNANLCVSTNVTDRRTDDMRSQDRALHYSASRGEKFVVIGGCVYVERKCRKILRYFFRFLGPKTTHPAKFHPNRSNESPL